MRKAISAAILFSFSALAVISAGQTTSITVTGFLTDTSCGRKGATSLHVDCAKRKVAAGTAKYAIYDEATKRLYILEPQASAEQYLGQRVRITGSLTSSRMTRAGQVLTSTSASTSVGGSQSGLDKVESLPKSLDASTPIAGVLTIASVEAAPARQK
jgi:hypothetical protein